MDTNTGFIAGQTETIALSSSHCLLAQSLAKELNGRISNWTEARPSLASYPNGIQYATRNCGRYSRSCSYIRYQYIPLLTCFGVLACDNKSFEFHFRNEVKTFKAPKGYCFGLDGYGWYIALSKNPKKNYHFNSNVWENGVKALIAEFKLQIKNQIAAKLQARQNKRFESFFKRDAKNTRVTLFDSRRAGNCVEGTIKFAEKYLGLDRETILNGAHLIHVAASKLLKSGDGRAHAAAKQAWMRETMVCI